MGISNVKHISLFAEATYRNRRSMVAGNYGTLPYQVVIFVRKPLLNEVYLPVITPTHRGAKC